MPLKEWIIELEEARIEIWRETHAGAVVSFAVVLIALVGDEWVCVTRYDCAHGFPHRDALGQRSGLLYKEAFQSFTMEQVFHHAIRDCQENCEAYLRFYQAH
jgi:hypothetical protein